MKSNLFTKISLCLLALTASVAVYPMGGYYEPDPKAVTTEEKINHYLFYMTGHAFPVLAQHGLNKAVPVLFERAVVDGARMFVPEVLGLKTPNQKRLLNLGIEGARQAVRFSATMKEFAQKQGKKYKRSDAIKTYLAKQFIPIMVKSLVVDLLYYGSGHFTTSLLQRVGFNTATLASSPNTITGMLYQQAKASGYDVCGMAYDLFFKEPLVS